MLTASGQLSFDLLRRPARRCRAADRGLFSRLAAGIAALCRNNFRRTSAYSRNSPAANHLLELVARDKWYCFAILLAAAEARVV